MRTLLGTDEIIWRACLRCDRPMLIISSITARCAGRISACSHSSRSSPWATQQFQWNVNAFRCPVPGEIGKQFHDPVGHAGVSGSLRHFWRKLSANAFAGQIEQAGAGFSQIALEGTLIRHGIVIEIKNPGIDQIGEYLERQIMGFNDLQQSLGERTARAGRRSFGSPMPSTSRHHCRRISPGKGSETLEAIAATSALNA